ncbi:MAG: PAS domain S-box protein [Drouetiella hepatica Uher 2000/2452]|uniref:histidine kinase n=1 Tax=Drouetiella hepatica Uher 2000/2452 TaxID=904376 RepID=A0A951QF56_9CYAN|nr:PAS domain S-box protein [Drouetiella hepatica Uher 2000/2452]
MMTLLRRIQQPNVWLNALHPEAPLQAAEQNPAVLGTGQTIPNSKQAAVELRRSKDLFEAIFEESADAIFLVDATAHLTLTCNHRTLELFEADGLKELIGIRGSAVLHKHPFTPAESAAVKTALEHQGTWQGEVEYLTRQGNTFWGNVACKRIEVADKPMVLVRITDISDRKRTEAEHQQAVAALRQSEARFQHLVANIPGIFYQSLIRADGLRQFNYVSSGFQRLFELEPAQLMEDAMLFWTMVHPEDVEPLRAEMTRTLVTQEPFQLEYRIIPASGRIKWIHNVASRQYLANGDIVSDGVVLDITDRKVAEAALQISEQNLRTIINNVNSQIWVHDADGTILDVNDRVLEHFALEREQMLERSLLDVIPPEAHAFHQSHWQRAIAGEEKEVRFECQIPNYDGSNFIDLDIILNRIIWGGKAVILGSVQDVSDRKQAELRLKRQAEADQLLAAIAQTISQSIQLDEVLETCLEQIRQFLQCDRIVICRFDSDYNIVIEREAVSQPEFSLLGRAMEDSCFGQAWAERYQQGYTTVRSDTQAGDLVACHAEFLDRIQVRANLVVGILQAHQIWGLLIAHHCREPRQWQPFEVDLLKQLALQVGIAGQKSDLYTQLEAELTTRRQTEQALAQQVQRERVLRTLSQQIRQSLRLDEILATTVTEVRQLLEADRAVIFQLNGDRPGTVIQESWLDNLPVTAKMHLADPHLSQEFYDFYLQGRSFTVNGVEKTHASCPATLEEQIGVKSKIVAPILQTLEDNTPTVWGLLIVQACADDRQWQPAEVDLLQQLATQVGIAIQQAALYSRIENQLAQKEVLFKEVHHRVKNNLQVISSMLWLQTEAANHPAVSRALADTRNRLHTMSLIHETLYQQGDLGQINFHDYIRRLTNSILAVYATRPDQIALRFHLQPVTFNLETAIPCGLLLNELVTNAIKHGFPNGQHGEVCITLEHVAYPEHIAATPSTSPNSLSSPKVLQASSQYILTIQDNGIGIPATLNLNRLQSLGLKIAYDLALQLEGSLELERTHGTRFCLTFSALAYGKRL